MKLETKLQENQSLGSQLRANLKKLKTKDLFAKDARIEGSNSVANRGEIKKIRIIKDKNENVQNQRLNDHSFQHHFGWNMSGFTLATYFTPIFSSYCLVKVIFT
jgi:hypothetical protein